MKPNQLNADQADGTRQVRVALGERSYAIHIGSGALAHAGALVGAHLARPRTVIVADRTVAGLHLPALCASLDGAGIAHESILVDPGEGSKTFATLERICDELLKLGVERNDTIIAFGGGVTGDLAGFAAAILRRGVHFVQIPTTLLAQVDSSVGGKTAINSRLGKNLIGAFHQPALVIADTDLLRTLPARQMRAGYAEVVKYALISDAGFFDWLANNHNALFACESAALAHAVATSCASKADIVARDERESGQRALLNLGHTFGHALEAAAGYTGRILHGEAVAAGLAMAFRFSARLGICGAEAVQRVETHLRAAGLAAGLAELPGPWPDADALIAIMAQDKKTVAGKPVLVLARDIGDAFIARDIDRPALLKFLNDQLADL